MGFNYKATHLSVLFKFILPETLRKSLQGSNVLLFLEFINMVHVVSILFCNFIEFIVLLYTFLVIFVSRYKKYDLA